MLPFLWCRQSWGQIPFRRIFAACFYLQSTLILDKEDGHKLQDPHKTYRELYDVQGDRALVSPFWLWQPVTVTNVMLVEYPKVKPTTSGETTEAKSLHSELGVISVSHSLALDILLPWSCFLPTYGCRWRCEQL